MTTQQDLTDESSILQSWIGRTQTTEAVIHSQPTNLMCQLLDYDRQFKQNDELPPLWHWLYFIDSGKQSDLGYDGHPKLGNFLPPVALPRRMWASGEFSFSKSLRVGQQVTRHSSIKDVQLKEGKSGKLCFVTVKHQYTIEHDECFAELHNIVYRGKHVSSTADKTIDELPQDYDWQSDIIPDPILLFRYSALTFNGHRIHYDRDFCTQSEGYPGLVFHGPLTATLLIEQVRKRYQNQISHFTFKAIKPIFDIDKITLFGKQIDEHSIKLWAVKNNQQIAMQAAARAIRKITGSPRR